MKTRPLCKDCKYFGLEPSGQEMCWHPALVKRKTDPSSHLLVGGVSYVTVPASPKGSVVTGFLAALTKASCLRQKKGK